MLILENIKFAFSSLWDNKIRSCLTMLGVIIGVFSVITLISIGEGVRNEFTNQITDIGSNLVITVPGQIDTESEEFNPASAIGVSSLTEEDAQAVQEQVEHLDKLAWMMLINGIPTNHEQISKNTMIIASQPAIADLLNQDIAKGRFLTDQDLEQEAHVVVLTHLAREELFDEDEKVLGKKIMMRNEEFRVIGILEKKENAFGMSGMSFDDIAYIPFTTAQEITEQTSIFRIMGKADSPETVESVKEQMHSTLLEQHDDTEDFSVLTQDDLLGMFDSMFAILTQAIVGIAAISLVVGGIGIMNIMLVSVTERTKEIGTRKALGATSTNILVQFLIEAAVLSCVGGGIGVALSYGIGQLITEYADIPTYITTQGLLLAILISVGVGIIFGLMPAIKAAQKNPIEALRYE